MLIVTTISDFDALLVNQGDLQQAVHQKKKMLEGGGTLANAVPISGMSGYFRWRNGTFRLIGRHRIVEGEPDIDLLIFVNCVHKESFSEATNSGKIAYYEARIEQEWPRIEAEVRRRLSKAKEESLPELPEEFSSYLTCNWSSHSKTYPVLESFEWRTKVWNLEFERLHPLYEALFSLLDRIDHEAERGMLPDLYHATPSLYRDPVHPFGIAYIAFQCPPALRMEWEWLLFLLFLQTPEEREDRAIIAEKIWEEIRNGLPPEPELAGREEVVRNLLAQHAATAYPVFVLYEEEIWRRFARQMTTELALSAEEVSVLNKFRRFASLPALLEGRAGSGKSTMLFYFLAELAGNWMNEGFDPSRAVFITQSERLKEEAQHMVGTLLDLRSKLHGSPLAGREGGALQFQTMYSLCRESLRGTPEHARFSERSPLGGYVNLRTFHRLLHASRWKIPQDDWAYPFHFRSMLPPQVTSELAWFVIRSYIKGHAEIEEGGATCWMSPDEYQRLPAKDRHVDATVFREVYEKIWPWYRRWTVGGNGHPPQLWDDQDLILAVLRNRGIQTQPSGEFLSIVCDEAQDFTYLEMKWLLSSFLFKNYRIDSRRQRFHLPLLVAADPFQTINPSGFRWEGVKRALDEQLEVSNLSYKNVRVHHEVLHYNYRNTAHIARLANAIQFMRRVLLGYKVEAQHVWRRDEAAPITWVEPDEQLLHSLAEAFIDVIVPHLDESELPPLKQLLQITRQDGAAAHRQRKEALPPFILRPADIKGLERSRIVVLGFGDFFVKRFGNLERRPNSGGIWKWRNAVDDPRVEGTHRYALEYFLNNIYVAITRARDELFIVDSPEGIRRFWGRLLQERKAWHEEEEALHDALRARPFHPTDTHFLFQQGTMGDMRERNLICRAKEWEERGRSEGDFENLERALWFYHRAAQQMERGNLKPSREFPNPQSLRKKASECRAYSRYYQGNIREGGIILRDEVQDLSRARNWFWQGRCWEELLKTLSLVQPPLRDERWQR